MTDTLDAAAAKVQSFRPSDKAVTDLVLEGAAAERARIWTEVERLGLEAYAHQLDIQGFTLVPPAASGMTDDFIDEVRETALDLLGQKTGVRPDFNHDETRRGEFVPGLYYFLFQAQIFEKLLMNEAGLALASYLLGEKFALHTSILFVNGPADGPTHGGKFQTPLHTGLQGLEVPDPYPAGFPLFADVAWALTDFGPEDGGTIFVPGSHMLKRGPAWLEGDDKAVVAECPKGTMLVWHGNTWHGGQHRSKQGLRGLLTYAFSPSFFRQFNPYAEDVTDEILARNPKRFAEIMGATYPAGWREEGIYEFNTKRAARFAEIYGPDES